MPVSGRRLDFGANPLRIPRVVDPAALLQNADRVVIAAALDLHLREPGPRVDRRTVPDRFGGIFGFDGQVVAAPRPPVIDY